MDAVVAANAALVGGEVEGLDLGLGGGLRVAFCAFYALEWAVRLAAPRRLLALGPLCDAAVVLAACVGVFVLGGQPELLWRLTVLRAFRFLRVWSFARYWWPIKDIYLLVVGVGRASASIAWYIVALGLVVFAAGAAGMGFVGRIDAESSCAAGEDCLDLEEYFGSLPRAMLTALQVATLDGWAATIVRPLSGQRPLAAFAITGFAICASYALFSVFAGVMAESTIRLARSHDCHESQLALTDDLDTIATMGAKLRELLILDGQALLDCRMVRDAMFLPEIGGGFQRLDLPLQVPEELFEHLDTQRAGAMTVEEFERGVASLKRPSTTLDVALLTATIGGSATFCSRIDHRAQSCIGEMERLKDLLTTSFDELSSLADPASKDSVPEVYLRSSGKIFNPVPPRPMRYT